jgi:hypothetical protein
MENWKINLNNVDPRFPFIVVDNWYNDREQNAIWKELELYNVLPNEYKNKAEQGPVAKKSDGSSKSQAYRFYLNDIYKNGGIKYSPILNCTYKIVDKKLDPYIEQCTPYSRHYFQSNKIFSLVSYYEEDDHYHSHFDSANWTCLIWFAKDKNLFDGGDFYFPESNNLIKLKHNRAVLFPGSILHAVTPVKFKSPPKDSALGRFTITHFLNYEESEGAAYIPIDRIKQ